MGFEKKLSDVQNVILNIMKEIKNFLDENAIEYYMLGGTLLGAVRHKGFIPWDDDIDIGIPRNQYSLFLENIEKKLPEYLKVNTFKNSKNHHYYFSRIVDTRYYVKRTGSEVERYENVWVDIFPLDGMPNNFIIREIHKIRLLFIRVMYHLAVFDKVNLKRPNRPLSERIVIKFVQLTGFGRNGDMYKWLERLDKALAKYPYEESDWVINFIGQYKFKEMFHKKYYGNGKLYQFEDLFLRGPENADHVLTQMYGDYMKPPKDEDKNVHASVVVR